MEGAGGIILRKDIIKKCLQYSGIITQVPAIIGLTILAVDFSWKRIYKDASQRIITYIVFGTIS